MLLSPQSIVYPWKLRSLEKENNYINIHFWRSVRISWIGADPPPYRAERARGGAGGAVRGAQRRCRKSARASESFMLVQLFFRPVPADAGARGRRARVAFWGALGRASAHGPV